MADPEDDWLRCPECDEPCVAPNVEVCDGCWRERPDCDCRDLTGGDDPGERWRWAFSETAPADAVRCACGELVYVACEETDDEPIAYARTVEKRMPMEPLPGDFETIEAVVLDAVESNNWPPGAVDAFARIKAAWARMGEGVERARAACRNLRDDDAEEWLAWGMGERTERPK
jgi:hypothetical protein